VISNCTTTKIAGTRLRGSSAVGPVFFGQFQTLCRRIEDIAEVMPTRLAVLLLHPRRYGAPAEAVAIGAVFLAEFFNSLRIEVPVQDRNNGFRVRTLGADGLGGPDGFFLIIVWAHVHSRRIPPSSTSHRGARTSSALENWNQQLNELDKDKPT
jgi:hypothetical protein